MKKKTGKLISKFYLDFLEYLQNGFITKKQIKKHIFKRFVDRVGYEPNIDNPKSFNEKLQWLKLYYRNPLLTKCSDKFEVREYVKEKIGEKYLTKLLGAYDRVEQINFNKLPDKFVLKVNHGSGQNIICKDKDNFDLESAREKLKQWVKPESNHYNDNYEWGYKNIRPKIVCEEYIEQLDGNLLDYKLLCFDGDPKFIWVDIDRFGNHRRNFYDLSWTYLSGMQLKYPNDSSVTIERPVKLGEMIEIARKLSNNFPHVRVDLYLIKEKVYFGELTFYSVNGMGVFSPIEWDYKLGNMVKLPKIEKHCRN